jgi:hypothetical protein
MTALEILLAKVLAGVAIIMACTWGFNHYIATVEQRGYDRAVSDGKIALQIEKDRALGVERQLRVQLSKEQRLAAEKEIRHAEELAAAQARLRSGADRLLCPKRREIPGPSPDADRSIAGGTTPDAQGEAIVPDVAAEILGDAATIAGLVRKFGRLEGYFAVCRAVANGEPVPPNPDRDSPLAPAP